MLGGVQAQSLLERMDGQAPRYAKLSRQIWELAELGFQETRSAALLQEELRRAGFQVENNVGGMPTAFTATWGTGKPVIALLGEYDALPGLSQEDVPVKKPRAAGGPGHGCGHNLLGVGALFAAIAAKEHLAEKKLPGVIRYYGTPAEEGGGGKILMARAGAFRDVDAVLTWHPGNANAASPRSSTAIIDARFRFLGKAAHAAAAQERGRSALDAALLMAHAVDMLREHVPQETRMHYIISRGGMAPNIVPDLAEVDLYARHPEMGTLDGIWERVLKCAQAGALATETRLETELVSNYGNILVNDALVSLLDRNLRRAGGQHYTAAERQFADQIRASLEGPLPPLGTEEKILSEPEGADSASTDVGDISWMLPTGGFRAATYAPGVPGHSWQAAACAGTSIGQKGMLTAAKTLALSAIELFTDSGQLEAARASFQKRRAGREYRSRIPADAKPRLDYRDRH
ncbi:MAG: amidohydrolase [Acidobacteria bacterium]|nr:amidohydrolase [Acidobacteriota bacterium]